jgi:hypothetical protein
LSDRTERERTVRHDYRSRSLVVKIVARDHRRGRPQGGCATTTKRMKMTDSYQVAAAVFAEGP